MPSKRISFKIPTEFLIFKWSSALAENLSWNDFIADMLSEKEFMASNEEFFNGDSEFAQNARNWAVSTYPDKSESYQMNQARMFIVSEKVLTKINNLRSRKDFKNAQGLAIDRPHGVSERIGLKRGGKAKRLDWNALLGQFSADDFNGQ